MANPVTSPFTYLHLLHYTLTKLLGGRIIFISATIHYTAVPLQTHVSVAKAGIDALSASCAIELGPRGITSNVIAPGPIEDTEGMLRLARVEDRKAAQKRMPLGRGGKVRDIADATVYLFAETGDFVSGQVLVGKFSFFAGLLCGEVVLKRGLMGYS